MLGNRRRDTRPELAVRRLLHAAGLRYRVDYPLPTDRRRRADIAFTRLKVVVFIDGCFWHLCGTHGRVPTINRGYWEPKLRRNAERDVQVTEAWSELGWTVMRFWEHEDPASVAASVMTVVLERAAAANRRSG
jgi:DNA mismatch endonuclease (patch repair protein)